MNEKKFLGFVKRNSLGLYMMSMIVVLIGVFIIKISDSLLMLLIGISCFTFNICFWWSCFVLSGDEK